MTCVVAFVVVGPECAALLPPPMRKGGWGVDSRPVLADADVGGGRVDYGAYLS